MPHDDSQHRAAVEVIAWARGMLAALRNEGDASRPLGSGGTADALRSTDAAALSTSPSDGAGDGHVGNAIFAGNDGLTVEELDTGTDVKPAGLGLATEAPMMPVWWEGEEIQTVVVPISEDSFVREDGNSKPAGQ